jgi:peptidoglycan hydrolase CwlO-like protein
VLDGGIIIDSKNLSLVNKKENMLSKKRFIIVGIILSIVMLFGLVGCSKPTDNDTDTTATATTSANPYVQLQTDVAALQSDVAGLKVSVNNIQAPTDFQPQITALQTKLNTIQVKLNDLENNANEDDTDYAAQIEDIRTDLTSLANTVNTIPAEVDALNEDIENIQEGLNNLVLVLAELGHTVDNIKPADLTAIQTSIETIEGKITTMQDKIETMLDNDFYLNTRITDLETAINALNANPVEVKRFIQGSSYMEFKVNQGGNYAIIVTLYGTNLDTVTVTIPNSNAVNIISDNCYGAGNTIKVLILEPKQAGNPLVNQNWTLNKVVELAFTNANNIQYVKVDTANR